MELPIDGDFIHLVPEDENFHSVSVEYQTHQSPDILCDQSSSPPGQSIMDDYCISPLLKPMYYENQAPFLTIIEQPIERCRFRYKAETSDHGGTIRGSGIKKQKRCPRVMLHNVNTESHDVVIFCRLYTNERPPRPHVNELWGNNCDGGQCSAVVDRDNIASFPNLGVMREKEKDFGQALLKLHLKCYKPSRDEDYEIIKERAANDEKSMKDCSHVVLMGFWARITAKSTNEKFQTPLVFSQPIVNTQSACFTELKIAEVDKSCSSVLGGETIWMRCAAKVRRDQIRIVFMEPSSGWRAEGNFTSNEVYEQILIIFQTPAYHRQDIQSRVTVEMRLYRANDDVYSMPHPFDYLPIDEGNNRKRRRIMPVFTPDSFGFSNATYTPSTSHLPDGYEQSYNPSYYSASSPSQGFYCAAPKKQRSMDVGRKIAPGQATELITAKSHVTLDDLCSGIVDNRLNVCMAQLWRTQVHALWAYSAEGDIQPMVSVCKNLIAYQDRVEGNTALHLCARNGQSSSLRTILQCIEPEHKSLLVNIKNIRGQTPLHLAVRFGDAACVHYLLSNGAKRGIVDCDGNTTVHLLADTFNEDVYKDILFPPTETDVIDFSAMNNDGNTPLHISVRRLKTSLVDNLLEACDFDVLLVGDRCAGRTPLHLAAQTNDVDIAEMIIKKCNNDADLTKRLVDARTSAHDTALHMAVRRENECMVALLLKNGADAQAETLLSSQPDDADDEIEGDEPVRQSAFDIAANIVDEKKRRRMLTLLQGGQVDGDLSKPELTAPSPTSLVAVQRRIEALAVGENMAMPDANTLSSLGVKCSDNQIRQSGVHRTPQRQADHPCSSSSLIDDAAPASLDDDVSTLSFVTRMRLATILDADNRWQMLAKELKCEHMIEFLQVVTSADPTQSPTALLLDQYEHVPGATISILKTSLKCLNFTSATETLESSHRTETSNRSTEEQLEDRKQADENSKNQEEA